MSTMIDWWPRIQPWWHSIELLIQGAMFFVILWALRRSRLKLKTVVDDLGRRLNQRIADVQEAVDQPSLPAPANADPESWEHVRDLWRKARMRIEQKVEAITDRPERRKYDSLSRYTYDGMLKQLRKDNLISAGAADALETMNESFLSLRRSRAATAEKANAFAKLYEKASPELPELREE
jgi:hypothetical protein